MFVCSFKLTSVKIIAAFLACIVGAIVVISLLPDAGYALNVNKTLVGNEQMLTDLDKAEDCVRMLAGLGIEVEEKPVQSGNVTVPETFDAAFEKYNDLQKSQGFDLEKYHGKKVKRYTFKVKSTYGKVPLRDCFATVIVYKKKAVGADICCPETGEYGAIITSKSAS